MSKRSKRPESPIPAYSEPESAAEETVVEERAAETEVVVEEEAYQLEQETVSIEAVPPACPRCGSTERTPLKEISPRIEMSRGILVRYRTQCRGKIQPVDKDGKPVVDAEGKPIYYECGNRYKVKKTVPKTRKSAS